MPRSAAILVNSPSALPLPSSASAHSWFGAAPLSPQRILFVDDSPSVRVLVRATLDGAGFDVVEAANGVEAWQQLDAGESFDLLLTDLHMPKLNGLDLIRRVRGDAEHRYLPIVMLTTESLAARVSEGREAGATAWVIKPFEGRTLLRVIEKIIGKRS